MAYVTMKWTGKKYRKSIETSRLLIDQVLDIVMETGQKQTNTYINFIFVDRASRYNCVKINLLDAQLILSIFRQPQHVSGVSRPIIGRYSCMCTTVGTYSF